MTHVKTEQEQTIDALPKVGKRRYLIKAIIPHDDMIKVTMFIRASIAENRPISLPYLAKHLGISYNTTRKWFRMCQTDPFYDPTEDRQNMVMSERLENTIMQVIEEQFLEKNYFFNNEILKLIALHAWNLANPEDKLKNYFTASDGWCQNFRQRNHYVWRKAHLKRRPTHDAKYIDLVEKFNEKFFQIREEHKKMELGIS
jgi:hypothetical protein